MRETAFWTLRMVVPAAVFIAATAFALLATPAWASPPDNVWIEDLAIHPSGPAELDMTYDLIEPDSAIIDGEVDQVTIRTLSGMDRAPMDWSPSIGMLQIGNSDLRLSHVGLRIRYRLQGTPSQPRLGLVFGYRAMLFGTHEHQLRQGIAGRCRSGPISVGWEAGLAEELGEDTDVEARVGLSLTYGALIGLFRASLESFALIPVTGQRISDYGLGQDSSALAVYVGPSLRLHTEYVWISGSVVTGRITDNGSPWMVRVTMGTQF